MKRDVDSLTSEEAFGCSILKTDRRGETVCILTPEALRICCSILKTDRRGETLPVISLWPVSQCCSILKTDRRGETFYEPAGHLCPAGKRVAVSSKRIEGVKLKLWRAPPKTGFVAVSSKRIEGVKRNIGCSRTATA